ncbi:MAG: hypothetical protein IT423_20785 [Pirellulaceae bacterium]|nr:hypothetical protein [Pirellulaceae bacterium]
MNYLSHGFRFVDNPYYLAGTALPDWMSVLDRRNRARSQVAAQWVSAAEPEMAAFAQGVVQHHADDRWFHQTESFALLSTTFAVELREKLTVSHQAGFLGHIAVELLLDAVLVEDIPIRLEAYYNALSQLDPRHVQVVANRLLPRPAERLDLLLPRFIAERFLADYADDRLLWRRLNHVMRRVGLEPLPETIIDWLATARVRVRQSADALLTDSTNISIRRTAQPASDEQQPTLTIPEKLDQPKPT